MTHKPEFPSLSILDSRRLTGPNVFGAHVGAVLELEPGVDDARLTAWAERAGELANALGWHDSTTQVRRASSLVNAFLAAPAGVLMTATEVNEQAWVLAESGASPDDSLVARLALAANAERAMHPHLDAVSTAAAGRGVSFTFDDESVTVGSGAGSRTWPLAELPAVKGIAWENITDVPIALVTGSNGKTTTARLVAAMWTAAGRTPGWSCSDGVWVGDEQHATGDYSGPAGARVVLRNVRAEAAVLETARGGMLRRGLATTHAHAAIITNVSADHFGEYGIDSLEELAEVKAVVARALGARGTLVLNADDPVLAAMPPGIAPHVAWFSATPGRTDTAAGVVDGRGVIRLDGATHDIGVMNEMPITLDGAAPHNVSNVLGAALLAAVLGVPVSAIRSVCATFGTSPRDNPGRLQVSRIGGVTVLTDYAHNPGGLAALCATAASMPAKRRLLLLGQAGNRDDEQVRELARAALSVTRFDRVIIKEMPSMLRGREVGELSRLFHDELLRGGMREDQLETVVGEREAIRHAMAWAHDGDLLVCPVHVERPGVHAWLNVLDVTGWHSGDPVPE